MISFDVRGVPAPKGSLKAVRGRGRANGRTFLVPDNDKELRPWVKAIKKGAVAVVGKRSEPLYVQLPLEVVVVCRLPRPQHHYGVRGLLPSAPAAHAHTVKPDGDKLLRAVLDALTGIVYDDDARIPAKTIIKQWAERGCEGATITVRRMPISMQGTLDLSSG